MFCFYLLTLHLVVYVWYVGLHPGLVVSLAYCHGRSLEALFAVVLPMSDVSDV